MNRGFSIDFRHNRGNLYIELYGLFTSMCAWELLKVINKHYCGSGRVFVNTNKLDRVLSEGKDLFKSHLNRKRISKDKLYFKGEKGRSIAPDGSRVIVRKKGVARQKKTCRGFLK